MGTTADGAWTESAGGELAARENGSGGVRRGQQQTHGGARHGEALANFLGWFSVGLGVAQLVAPDSVARLIGVRPTSRNRNVMRALGVRELASGVGILSKDRPAEFVWGRVAGDTMDLALLGRTMASDDTDKRRASLAAAAVLGVGALDYVCARQLSDRADDAQEGRALTSARSETRHDGIHVKRSITVNRPVEEVYGFWQNFENLPRFMRHLESVRVLGDGRSRWRALAPAGKTVEWDAETTDDRPNELIAWRSLPGADVRNAGMVRFQAAPGGRGTEVHVELTYDPPGGVLGSKLAKLFREEPSQQIADDLRAFKQVLETGEVVVSDATVRRGPHPARPSAEEPRIDSYEREIVVARSGEAADATTSNRDRADSRARHEQRA